MFTCSVSATSCGGSGKISNSLHFTYISYLLTEKQVHKHDTFWRKLSLTCEKNSVGR